MDSEQLILEFVAIDKISDVVQDMGKKISEWGDTLASMAGSAGPAMAAVGDSIGIALKAMGGLLAVGGGLFALLDHLATKTADYALSVEQMSNRLDMSTGFTQTVMQAMNLLGVSTQTLNQNFTFFAKQLESGAPNLKKYSESLKDVGITTTSIEPAFLQLADWFSKSDDAIKQAAVAAALFGRNAGPALTALLRQGAAGIQELNREFANFGLVLSDGQLQLSAIAKVMQDKLHLEMQGMELQIGQALIPAFMMLWDVLGKIINPAGQFASTAEAVAHALEQAVIWLAAFISALTGVTVSMADFNSTATGALSLLLKTGVAAGDAADPVQTLAQTVAGLNDQISQLQDAQAAFDEGMQGQTDAIRAQQQAYDDLTQSQLASLDAQKQAIDLAFQQWNQQNALADAQNRLAADQQLLAKESQKAGFDPTALRQQIIADQNAVTRQKATMAVDAAKNAIDLQKRTLEAEKKLKDDAWKDDIARLDSIKKSTDRSYKEQIKALQEQVKETQKADNALTVSNNALTAQTTANDDKMRYASQTLAHDSQNDMATMQGSFADAAASGVSAFGQIRDAVGQMKDAISVARTWLKALEIYLSIILTPIDLLWQGIMRIADAFGWVADRFRDLVRTILSMPQPLQGAAEGALAGALSALHVPGFDLGGIVPGPVGQPQVAIVHGGERIYTPDQQIAEHHSTGGDNAETNALLRQLIALFSSTGSNGQFMTVMRALMQQMNSQGARGVRGAGYWPA